MTIKIKENMLIQVPEMIQPPRMIQRNIKIYKQGNEDDVAELTYVSQFNEPRECLIIAIFTIICEHWGATMDDISGFYFNDEKQMFCWVNF